MSNAAASPGQPKGATRITPAFLSCHATSVTSKPRAILPPASRTRIGFSPFITPVPRPTTRLAPLRRSLAARATAAPVGPAPASSPSASPSSTKTSFGTYLSRFLVVLRQAQDLSGSFWDKKTRPKNVLWWTIAAVFLAFCSTIYTAGISFTQRLFWNALSTKNAVAFKQMLMVYIAMVLIGPVVLVLYDWCKNSLALRWRRHLTKEFLSNYMTRLNYYKIQGSHEIDNPDQRIADDIKQFTDQAVSLICTIIVAFFDFIVFSTILYKIHPPLLFTLIVYATFGTSMTLFFGRRLVQLNVVQLEKEADSRFSLVRVRENAESVAFYGGEQREQSQAWGKFQGAFTNYISLLGFQRNLEFFTTAYRYFVQVLPTILIAPKWFAGEIQMGVISQTMFSFNHVLNDLGLIVTEFVRLSKFSAGVRRLHQMKIYMDKEHAQQADSPKFTNTFAAQGSPPALQVNDLCVFTPSLHPRSLAQNATFTIAQGDRLLVVGESGIGKSSLMRAIAGLWPESCSGSVVRPAIEDTLFLPQKPYMTLGSLRDNLLYPNVADETTISDDEIQAALVRVNLPNVVERLGGLDVTVDIGSILSLGEQQRLAFCRLILFKPKFVICDESTSALDMANEARMYDIIVSDKVTCLSVGNRPSLLDHHSEVIRLLGDGKWRIETIEEARSDSVFTVKGGDV